MSVPWQPNASTPNRISLRWPHGLFSYVHHLSAHGMLDPSTMRRSSGSAPLVPAPAPAPPASSLGITILRRLRRLRHDPLPFQSSIHLRLVVFSRLACFHHDTLTPSKRACCSQSVPFLRFSDPVMYPSSSKIFCSFQPWVTYLLSDVHLHADNALYPSSSAASHPQPRTGRIISRVQFWLMIFSSARGFTCHLAIYSMVNWSLEILYLYLIHTSCRMQGVIDVLPTFTTCVNALESSRSMKSNP